MSGDERAAIALILGNLSLSRFAVDRAAHLRGDPDALRGAIEDRGARVLALKGWTAPVRMATDGKAELHWFEPGGFEPGGFELRGFEDAATDAQPMLLGADPEGPVHLVVLVDEIPETATGVEWRTLREIGHHLPDADAGLLVTATALGNWHRAHRFCPNCGAATEISAAGWSRMCTAEGRDIFPRTDPSVITLVRDEDDCVLLGRHIGWEPGWFSTLAGFVESGESAEAALRREVREEAGVHVTGMTYLGSQPWPFPASLMLGYHSFVEGHRPDAVAEPEEMAEVRWFSRDELLAACTSGEVRLPPPVSIARQLVERWFGRELPNSFSRP